MIRLIEPNGTYIPSYARACAEYRVRQIQGYHFSDPLVTDVFAKFERYRQARELPEGHVGADYFWLVDDVACRFLGEVCIRHQLTEALERYGGHIGYGVRLCEQGKGYGTLMLGLALEKAKALGIDRALITCDDDNIASARVMEKNGFVLADKISNTIDGRTFITRRYWKTL